MLNLFGAIKICCRSVSAVRFYLVGTVKHVLFVKLQQNLWDFSLNTFKVTKYNVRKIPSVQNAVIYYHNLD